MNLEGITYRNEKGELKIQFVITWLTSSPGYVSVTSREEVKELIDKLLKLQQILMEGEKNENSG